MDDDFLPSRRPRRWTSDRTGAECDLYLGNGSNALEVLVTERADRPTKEFATETWTDRRDGRANPILLVVLYDNHAAICGPSKEDPPFETELDPGQIERIADAALDKSDRIIAQKFLRKFVEQLQGDLVGIQNNGLLTTHQLANGVPQRDDWTHATSEATPLLDHDGRDLIEGLGYEIERGDGEEYVLKHGSNGQRQAVAVLVDDGIAFDQTVDRFDDTPVGYALNAADRHQLDYVIASDGNRLRLYTTNPDAGFGSRGRTDTFVEIDTDLISDDRAGYLWLLFSAGALQEGGTLGEIEASSEDYAADLGDRLRARIYDDVVPDLAEAIAEARDLSNPDREDLDETFEMALYLLYRLLFVAYAEDERLLPRYNEAYERRSLKETAKELQRIVEDDSLSFDDSPTYWDEMDQLFTAIHDGRSAWGLPEYDGTLLSTDEDISPAGARLDEISLSDETFGPILYRLLIDEGPEEDVEGPVDFRNIGVREFGVIYEGLLESELSQAEQDLTLDDDDQYVPATEGDTVVVSEGEVYLHGLSGERKATGTYYTKSRFVEHLLDHSLDEALEEHTDRLDTIEDDDEAAAAFFDLRVADIAMGSGHFLVGAVDRIEKHLSNYLAERSLPAVEDELQRLKETAEAAFEGRDASPAIERDQVLRRQIARRCVYGVDLNSSATELARLSLWIHTFVPGLPLTFLDYNLRTGDSLAGVGTLSEVADEMGLEEEQTSLGSFSGDTDLLDDIEEKIETLGNFADDSAEQVAEAREIRAEIESELSEVEARFDVLAAARIDDDDRVNTSVASDQNIDPTITSSYDAAEELLSSVDAFHFPTSFPEVFVGDDRGFDVIVGNPPWEQTKIEADEFWRRYFPGLSGLSKNKQDERIAEYEAMRPDLLNKLETERQEENLRSKVLTNGPYPDMGRGDPDLYQGFSWRFWRLVTNGGKIGVILPRSAFISPGAETLRYEILDEADVEDLTFLKNRSEWAFDSVESRQTIGLFALSNVSVSDNELPIRGPYDSEEAFESGVNTDPTTFDTQVAKEWAGSVKFPLFPSHDDAVDVFRSLDSHPGLSEEDQGWRALPTREDIAHDEPSGSDQETDPEEAPDHFWPVFKGASFNPTDETLWINDTGERYAWVDPDAGKEYLQRKRKTSANRSNSPMYQMPNSWVEDESTLPCLSPRLAMRKVGRSSRDKRTLRASLIPPKTFLNNTVIYFIWPSGNNSDMAYLLGILSSIPADWYARRFVETHFTYAVIKTFPVPRPGRDSTLRQRVVELSGRLAAADDRYADWADAVGVEYGPLPEDEELEMIYELDAVVAHLYGLSREHLRVIFETFHDNWDHEPRMNAVLEYYDEWTEQLDDTDHVVVEDESEDTAVAEDD